MDLSQFDDNAPARSAPTTPQARTPPAISVTEPPAQEEEEAADTAPPDAEPAQSGATPTAGENQAQTDQPKDR